MELEDRMEWLGGALSGIEYLGNIGSLDGIVELFRLDVAGGCKDLYDTTKHKRSP